MNGAALAYIGDAVYELMVRRYVLEYGSMQPERLHKHATALVNAAAQSEMIGRLLPYLTEEEESVYKRGRNAHSPTMAKNATVGDYRRATGLEALIGYLYLKQDTERIVELMQKGLFKENKDEQ